MFPRLIATLALLGLVVFALPTGRQGPLPEEVDSDETRRVLGSSVVTSVSVIMDLGHGGAALLSESPGQHADGDNAAGSSQQSETFANSPLSTQKRPVGSPPALMSPDRYEFYTFDESGELVRRLMTLEQIQSLIAGGDDAHRLAALTADLETNTPPSPSSGDPQEEVVANVQQVLAEELLASIQKNGSEPQEGEVEVEAVVQEVPPPPSSPKPEQGSAALPENTSDGSHEDTGTSVDGSDESSGSTDSSGEDSGSKFEGVGSSVSSSLESSVGESDGDEYAGVTTDPVLPQDSIESNSEEYSDTSISDSSTEIPVMLGDKEKPSTPTIVSEKYGIYEISITTQSSSNKDDVKESTLTYDDKMTTVIMPTESSVGEDINTFSKHPEIPLKNSIGGGEVNASVQAVSIEDNEESKETLEEDKPVDHSHSDSPGEAIGNAELTNKNPPTVFEEIQPEESESFPDPIPEVILTPTKHRPEQTDDQSSIKLNEDIDTTTYSNKVVSEEPVFIPVEDTPSFDPQVDEIPNLPHTTDFQPPEEADLSAFFVNNNQTSSDATDVKEEDPMKIQGLLGLFSDKFSSLMGASDTFNDAGDQQMITTETESGAIQGDTEDPNQLEIQDPSASLLPPLVDEEEHSTTAQTGGINSGVTETSNIKDKDTATELEVDQEESDLLDELAESVSGILSQVSDFMGDSEDDASKKPFVNPNLVHSVRPPTVHPTEGETSVEDKIRNTTPTLLSSVEVISQETSTHAGHINEEVMTLLGEGATLADGMHDSESLKPDDGDHHTSSGYPTESFTEGSPATYDPMKLNDGSSTGSSVEIDSVTLSSIGESSEDVTKIPNSLLTTELPIKENVAVESGDDYPKITVPPEEGTTKSMMDTVHLSGGSSTPSVENSHGEKISISSPIEASQEGDNSSTDNSNEDERFESSTTVIAVEGAFEATATTQRNELEKVGDENDDAEKVTGITDKDASNNYASDPATTENIYSEVTSERLTEGSSPIKESVTHESSQEYSTVSSFPPAMKPLPNKTEDEYLLEEMHKVAEAESDSLLSTYMEDEQPGNQSSLLKDKDKPESNVPNTESGNDEEVTEDGMELTMTSDSSNSIHSTTEANPMEEERPSSTEFASIEELSPSSTSPDELDKEDGTSKPITSENAEQSVYSVVQAPSSNASEDDPSVSVNNLITPTSPDSIKPTTYRPVNIHLSTPEADDIINSHSSSSPDDLPDPNGLSPLLGEKKEPIILGNQPSDDPLSSATDKVPTASTAASSSPGVSSVVPPLMPALPPAPAGNVGLEATSSSIDPDVKLFVDLCNDLAFSLYSQVTGASQSVPNIRGTHGSGVQTRSLVVSPFAISSLLAMVFLGARGPTSEQMNDLLHLDDVVTFNPHLVLQNVTESVITSPGVSAAAFVRELYSDKSKGHLLEFYKARAKAFYEGHVEEVDFKDVNEVIRRRTNHLVRWQTRGRVPEYLRGSSLKLRPPLAALSANFFEADCQRASSSGSDGEMYFEVPAMGRRRRRLVPIPAVVWRGVFLAGYDPGLDATVLELRHGGGEVSTVLVLPGRHGHSVSDDPTGGLARLETWLVKGGKVSWSSLLRSAVPRGPIEVQLPRFAHRSVLNVTGALSRMGLHDLFTGGRADLRGLDGGLGGSLHLSDAIQMTAFGVCAEDGNSRRHLETYPSAQRTGRAGGEEEEVDEDGDATEETPTIPATTLGGEEEEESTIATTEPQRKGREAAWGEEEGLDEQSYAFAAAEAARELPLALRPRQARIPRPPQGSGVVLPRLRFDRPFLYFVRHNPSGFILLMGRFNPRLFP